MANKHFVSMRDIASTLAKKYKISKKAAGELLLQFIDLIWDHLLSGHKVAIRNLGVFHYRYNTKLRGGPGYKLYFKAAKKSPRIKNKLLTI